MGAASSTGRGETPSVPESGLVDIAQTNFLRERILEHAEGGTYRIRITLPRDIAQKPEAEIEKYIKKQLKLASGIISATRGAFPAPPERIELRNDQVTSFMEGEAISTRDVRDLLSNQKSELKEQVKTLESQDEREEVQQRLDQLKTSESECKEVLQEHQEKIRELELRQAAGQERLDSILQGVRNQELPTLQGALEESKAQLAEIETHFLTKKNEIDAENERFAALRREVEAKQATREEEITVLKKEIKRNPYDADRLEQLIRQKSLDRNNAAAQLTSEQGTHRQNVQRLTGELRELEGSLQAAMRKVERDTQDVADKEFVLEMEAIPDEIAGVQGQLETAEITLNETTGATTEAEQRLQELQSEAKKAEPLQKRIGLIKAALKVHNTSEKSAFGIG